MHIPDGYLSPSTCAVLYGASAPFWYAALRKLTHVWNTKVVPLLAVFAAFCFVVMMFNLPLPGGTTGHAVGIGICAIVLGPWAGMLCISLALFIQAIFFGDGGITTLGANCFNMAIVGSLVAFAVYRMFAGRTALTSPRRVLAGALAGYAAINMSALCAAIEFGIQPMLFHDAVGTPLYAPYSLSISIPAMMLGHLTFAGLAELAITAGLVRYLQRADPGLLRMTAPGSIEAGQLGELTSLPVRRLWLALAVLLIMTPLGILAIGSAWGEWTARDFSTPSARNAIAAASHSAVPVEHAPQGLERLSSLWTAPIPRYAPAFIRGPFFGYFVSAALGVGSIILLSVLVSWLINRLANAHGSQAEPRPQGSGYRLSFCFIERTAAALLRALEHTLSAEQISLRSGLLQQLDPRVKLAGLLGLILAGIAVRRISVLAGLLLISTVLGLLSRISISMLVNRVWVSVIAFSGVIALPAIFLTPGRTVYHLPWLHLPVQAQGLSSAAFLILRAEIAATLCMLLVLTTAWAQILKSLRFFRIPAVCVVLLSMSYRYIFLLIQTANEMFEARRARLVGWLDPPDRRRLAAASAGVLMEKSFHLTQEVHLAMLARGYRGEVYTLDSPELRLIDWVCLCLLLAIALLAIWAGRL